MRALLAAIRYEKGDLDANLASHLSLVAGAASAGCDLVVFPEMSLTGSVDPAVHPGRLVPADHPAVVALAGRRAGRVPPCASGIAERSGRGDPYITQVVAADGLVAGAQRKRHLGEGEEAFAAGTGSVIFDHAATRFGVAICAEAGFDAPFDSAVASGAGLVLFPAAPGAREPAQPRSRPIIAGKRFPAMTPHDRRKNWCIW